MYRLYDAWTPNVIKVGVALEEMGLPYERVPVNMREGDQFKPDYLAISPNNKVPALVDTDPADGGGELPVFESGAILIYLAEKHGRFLPTEPRARTEVVQWLMWQMAGFGPMLGQAHQFFHFAPEPSVYGVKRYATETARLYGVLDRRLQGREFVAGDYSIADMAIWPWAIYHDLHHTKLSDYPAVKAWFARIGERPAVKRALEGLQIPSLPMKPEILAILDAPAAA